MRRRLIALVFYSAVVFGLAWLAASRATTTILFVRYADIGQGNSADCDSPLSARGIVQARRLADFLESVDVVAGPDAIYATRCLGTQQTVGPLAKRLGLEMQLADPYDVVAFMKSVRSEHKREIVLIATDADSLPRLVEELHGSKKITDIVSNEIFVVTIPTYGKVKTLRLTYSE